MRDGTVYLDRSVDGEVGVKRRDRPETGVDERKSRRFRGLWTDENGKKEHPLN